MYPDFSLFFLAKKPRDLEFAGLIARLHDSPQEPSDRYEPRFFSFQFTGKEADALLR